MATQANHYFRQPMNFLVQQQPAYVYHGQTDFAAARPTVIFIHGAANDHRVWCELITALEISDARAYNLLAPDLPGHGHTFADAKLRIEDYADWIINLLDNGAIANATLVGHSMGSLIALDCARRYANRLDKLVLIGCAAPMPVAEKVLQTARDTPDAAFDMLTRASFHVEKNADGSWPPPSAAMTSYRALLGDSRAGVLANDMNACNRYAISEDDLRTISHTCQVIIGAQDRMTSPVAGAMLAAALPNATSITIERAGHAMVQEQCAAVGGALREFLNA